MLRLTKRMDGERRFDMKLTIPVAFDDITAIVALHFHRGDPWPTSRAEVLKMVRDHYYEYGRYYEDWEQSQHENWWAEKLMAKLFPEFNAVLHAPEICQCGHWREEHSSHGTTYCVHRNDTETECKCRDYRPDPQAGPNIKPPKEG